jgi:hypothetical protein
MSHFKGLEVQDTLYHWFQSILGEKLTTNSQPNRLQQAVSSLQLVCQAGWKLKMTADESPADKVGVDFIWQHETLGIWFPLDCSLREKTHIPKLIHLVHACEAGNFELGTVSNETKTAFAEQLVALTRQSGIKFAQLQPPSATSTKDLLSAIKSFQASLNRAATGAQREQFLEWATHLKKAVGYHMVSNRQNGLLTMELIAEAIKEGVNGYLTIIKASKEQPVKREFCRDCKVSYSRAKDVLYVPDKRIGTIASLSQAVKLQFEEWYITMIKQFPKLSESMLTLKRNFEANGFELIIHYILDVLEATLLGRPRPVIKAKAA